jgi:two-component system cell cycle sensor histidine kinase/response regulator CckA
MTHGKILLAEDDPMIQKVLARMISRAGYEGSVEVCADAASALEVVARLGGALDLILVDTNLHDEGDAAFFHALRALAPSAPIVASSGHSEEQLRGPDHFGGCDLYRVLSKPFGLQDVKDLIASLG